MTPERLAQVESLFHGARELDPDRRSAYLDRSCATDPELRREVDTLLAAQDSAQRQMAPLPLAEALRLGSVARSAGAAPPAERIGGYRLIRKLGEGGMSVVYLAEQLQPRRTVALKVLRFDAIGGSTSRLLIREAQILAKLSHPNIAQVFDAGVAETDGTKRSYVAMEYVPGRPITEFAVNHRCSHRTRVTLLSRVCDAVDHAHRRGVIHRDLKPANILVAPDESPSSDGDGISPPTPKVLDFGIARLLDAHGESFVTTREGQIVGTLAYMSPEQLEGRTALIDVRSDVYSLGIILYELLAGRPPHEISGGVAAAIRRLLENEPPPLRLFDSTYRGDLEAIVSKAMARERERRYASAAQLASDLRRWLNDEPVAARPATAWYRLAKLARRHRLLVSGVIGVILLLCISVAGLASLAASEAAQRARADRASREAQQQAAAALANETVARQSERHARQLAYRTAVIGAESMLRDYDVSGARRLLESAPEELRQWEWRYLWSQLDQSDRTLTGHVGVINALAFAPAGTVLASVSGPTEGRSEAALRLWSHDNGHRLGANVLAGGGITAISISPSGEHVVLGTAEGTVTFYKSTTAERHEAHAGHVQLEKRIAALAHLGPDVVLALTDAGRIHRWDAVAGRWDVLRENLNGAWRSARLGARVAATVCQQGRAAVHLILGDEPARWIGEDVRWQTIALSPSEELVATGGQDGQIVVWDVQTLQPRAKLRGHATAVESLCFNQDETRLASGAADTTVRLWDLNTGDPVSILRGHEASVKALAFSPDGRWLASGGSDTEIKLWDVSKPNSSTLGSHDYFIQSVAFAPHGDRVVTCSVDGVVRMWEVAGRRIIWTQMPQAGLLHEVAFSPDGGRLALGGEKTVLLDAHTGQTLRSFGTPHLRAQGVAFSPDGRRLATSQVNLQVWDVETGAELMFLATAPRWITDVAYSHDGRRLLSGGDRLLELFDAGSGARLWTASLPVQLSGKYSSVCWTSDDRFILLACRQCILVIESSSGALVRRLSANSPAALIECVAVSADGARVVAGNDNGALSVWDIGDEAPLLNMRAHQSWINSIAFSPNGNWIATAGGNYHQIDCTVKLWGVGLK